MANPPPQKTTMSYKDIWDTLIRVGAKNEEAATLTAIALAESGGDPTSYNPGTVNTPEHSYGLWQINLNAHPDITPDQAMTPLKAAAYALNLFREQGGKPWSVYNNNDYLQYMTNPTGTGYQPPLGPSDVTESVLAGFNWPKPEDYTDAISGITDYKAYADAVGGMASTWGWAGLPLPAGAPEYAQAAYQAAVREAQRQTASGQLNPSQIALYQMQATQIAQQIAQGEVLFPAQLQQIQQSITREGATLPLDIAKKEQDIRLGEPFGSEAVLRSPAGSEGYKDYWANRTPNSNRLGEPDYMAGFNLAQGTDQPRQNAIAGYLDNVIAEIGKDIEARGLKTTQAIEEVRNNLSAFSEAGAQFKAIQPSTIPTGSKFIPGFEPGGFATSIGLKEQAATPISYDPFKMSLDILKATPKPTSIGAPTVPSSYDPSVYQRALDFYKSLVG